MRLHKHCIFDRSLILQVQVNVYAKKIVSIERYQSDIIGPTLLFWINSWITITYFTSLKSTVISAKRTSNKNFNYQ